MANVLYVPEGTRRVKPYAYTDRTDIEELVFPESVRNIGDCDLRHVDVTDVLPEGTEFVSANPSPTSQLLHLEEGQATQRTRRPVCCPAMRGTGHLRQAASRPSDASG